VKAYFALSMQFCTHPFDATQIFSETKRRNICLIKQEHFVAIMMVNRKPRTNKRHILKGCPEPEEAQGTEAYFDSGTHHLHLSLPSASHNKCHQFNCQKPKMHRNTISIFSRIQCQTGNDHRQ
jgi:hypothetical protein